MYSNIVISRPWTLDNVKLLFIEIYLCRKKPPRGLMHIHIIGSAVKIDRWKIFHMNWNEMQTICSVVERGETGMCNAKCKYFLWMQKKIAWMTNITRDEKLINRINMKSIQSCFFSDFTGEALSLLTGCSCEDVKSDSGCKSSSSELETQRCRESEMWMFAEIFTTWRPTYNQLCFHILDFQLYENQQWKSSNPHRFFFKIISNRVYQFANSPPFPLFSLSIAKCFTKNQWRENEKTTSRRATQKYERKSVAKKKTKSTKSLHDDKQAESDRRESRRRRLVCFAVIQLKSWYDFTTQLIESRPNRKFHCEAMTSGHQTETTPNSTYTQHGISFGILFGRTTWRGWGGNCEFFFSLSFAGLAPSLSPHLSHYFT